MGATLELDAADSFTREEDRLINESLFDKIASTDPVLQKEGNEALTRFTRSKVRENGFSRVIMSPIQITNDDLDRSMEHEFNQCIIDKEPDNPPALSVGYNTMGKVWYIRGSRYKVNFHRIVSRRFTKDVSLLRTWIADLRQIIADNATKDMHAEEDSKWIDAHNTAVLGEGVVHPLSGAVQNVVINGGITRDFVVDMGKVSPSNISSLETKTVLTNHITIKDVAKWTRDQWGGDFAQKIMLEGASISELNGVRWIATIKKTLVPNNVFYLYPDNDFLGKNLILEDIQLWMKREAFTIEWMLYEEIGCSFGNTNGLAKVRAA